MVKLPPKAKIYEALSCIADKRIDMHTDKAVVTSSNYEKEYIVKWQNNNFSSTDNATFWQGYPGYPIIAVLMLQNKLLYNKEIIPYFAKINWHELNIKYKKDYDKAILEVLNNIDYNQEIIIKEIENIYENLKKMDINIKRKI